MVILAALVIAVFAITGYLIIKGPSNMFIFQLIEKIFDEERRDNKTEEH